MNGRKILFVLNDEDLETEIKIKLDGSGLKASFLPFVIDLIIESIDSFQPDLLVISTDLGTQHFGIKEKEIINTLDKIPIISISSDLKSAKYLDKLNLKPIGHFSKPLVIENLISLIELAFANKELKNNFIESKVKYQTVIKSGKTAYYEIDPVTLNIYGDVSLPGLFGCTTEEFIGEGWKTFFSIKDINNKKRVLQDLNQGKIQSYYLELQIVRKNSGLQWVASSGSLFCDINGVKKIIGTFSDITDFKLVDMKLKECNNELKKSNSANEKFFSIISHELRNPFNSLLGFSELLTNNIDILNESEIKESAGSLNKTAKNLFNLLTNLLEWARFQSGNVVFERTEFSLNTIINHVLSISNDSIDAKSIILTKETDCEIFVNADQNMVETAFRNLISNAIKFTKTGGSIKTGCIFRNNIAEVFVQDNGLGISEEDQNKLFKIEKLFTTEGTNNEKGTGFGLLLCKELIEKNGGSLNFISEKDKGSTFSFSLPARIN